MIIYVARVHLKKFTILCTRPWTLHFERWTQHHRSLGIRWVTTPLTHQAKFIISTPKKGRFLFTMGLLDWTAHCTYMCVTERSTRHAWPDGRIWRVHVLKKKKRESASLLPAQHQQSSSSDLCCLQQRRGSCAGERNCWAHVLLPRGSACRLIRGSSEHRRHFMALVHRPCALHSKSSSGAYGL